MRGADLGMAGHGQSKPINLSTNQSIGFTLPPEYPTVKPKRQSLSLVAIFGGKFSLSMAKKFTYNSFYLSLFFFHENFPKSNDFHKKKIFFSCQKICVHQ